MPRRNYVNVWAYLPEPLIEWLDKRAAANFTTRSGYIRLVLVELFKKENPE